MFIISIIIAAVFGIISWAISRTLKRKFDKYSRTPLQNGMSGAEAAQRMLHDYNIYDVNITCVEGELTDHYNPVHKTVNLSQAVYYGRNAAAVAVATHECGHAVQHATAYSLLQMRSKLVPLQNVAAGMMNFLTMVLIFGSAFFHKYEYGLLAIIACNLIFTTFAFITLPVEYDASNRALAWIKDKNIVTSNEYENAKDALTWASRTYLVAALASLANLLYWVLAFLGVSSDD